MAEPSESWLDWHFKTQLRTYTEEDLPAACLSDRVIMAKWLQVFKAAPVSQKMARNSLMLLMHGHLEDFGFLRAPFTDINNCYRDLNQVINGYHGVSLLRPLKNARSRSNDQANKEPQRVAGGQSSAYRSRSPKRIPSRSRLYTIAEELSAASGENVIERDTPLSALLPNMTTVKQRIQAIEKELARNKPPPLPQSSTQRNTHQSCRNEAKAPSNNRYDNRPSQDHPSQKRKSRNASPIAVQKETPLVPLHSTQNIRKCTHNCYCNDTHESFPDQHSYPQRWKPVCGCSGVVQKLKNCFQEASVRLQDPSKDDNPVFGRISAASPPPMSAKRTTRKCPSEEDLPSKTRLVGGQSIPKSYQRDKTIMDLLRRQEELRQECLLYYNLDGTLKKDLPVPTSLPKSKIEGFAIGASRAMERLKRWRGKPNQLKFFRTIFRGCGLASDVTGRVKALDRRFELVALQWMRRKRRLHPVFVDFDQKPPHSMQEVLEHKKAVKTEYMAHVAEIRKLCEILCRGVILPDVLDKMFHCLDLEYETANGDVERLEHQLKDMSSSTC
ncbi:hypothetical protein KR200_001709 [Drosophila serrata]|nr:hypothetical protein KR200_001709 [Drosophila serrata]